MTGRLGESGWAAGALLYGEAPPGAICCRCDAPVLPKTLAARAPGLERRGWAHADCLPSGNEPAQTAPSHHRAPESAPGKDGESAVSRARDAPLLRTRRAGAGRVVVVDHAGRVVGNIEQLAHRCWRISLIGVTHVGPEFSTRREAMNWLGDVTFPTMPETPGKP